MYAKIDNGALVEYPYDPARIRAANPNTSFPREMPESLLAEYGVYPVEPTSPPAVSIYERVIETSPALVDGVWRQQWSIVAASAPESITRRQCALQLLALNMISAAEALAMTKTADVPAAIASIFDEQVTNGNFTQEQRVLAEIDFAAANYYRDNQLLPLMGMTSEQIDQFFIAASNL